MQADHFTYHLLKEDLELGSSKWKEKRTHRLYLVVGKNTRGYRLVNTTAQVIRQGQMKAQFYSYFKKPLEGIGGSCRVTDPFDNW